mmetsp:Transcript_28594/g.85424  ORF Transcript_28594/g.85424 Transcript_28594/m.85424 type:complete len:184 (-) Transcript_28594:70-621(-)
MAVAQLVLLALGASALAPAPRRARVVSPALFAEPPALAYAADSAKAAVPEVSEASFVGQYELEENEDRDSAKTLMVLNADGKCSFGATDGVPPSASAGRWEWDGKELIVEIFRTFEGTGEPYSTTRVLIGDVVALTETPPQVSGAIKLTPSPTSDDQLRIPRHSLPTDAVGYFVAVKIPDVPL